ncbi:hypothetical protein FXO38_31496 [Capsicum annuum]|nr:hypothetical protein FXO38_31496 [Capsicum annuum]
MNLSIEVRWNPPPPGLLKLNTDVFSSANPGTRGIGGVFRNHSGLWILGYLDHLSHTSPTMAELLALRQGKLQTQLPTKIFKEQNTMLDLLAKEGTRAGIMQSPKIMCDMSPFIVSCVEVDINGITFRCFVRHSISNLQSRDVAPNCLSLAANTTRSTDFLPP